MDCKHVLKQHLRKSFVSLEWSLGKKDEVKTWLFSET